jgi:glycerate kinase
VIPRVVLVAACAFGRELSASRVAAAIGRGLQAGGQPEPDLCPVKIGSGGRSGTEVAGRSLDEVQRLLHAAGFDGRMRRARAVVIAEKSLHRHDLRGSATFEIATRARQAGVPTYAVVRENALDAFDARILDLQIILEAADRRSASERALVAVGRRLAGLV